jgi:C1A family cysteine protease
MAQIGVLVNMKQDPKTIIDIDVDPGLHRKSVERKIVKTGISISKFHLNRDKLDKRDYKYVPIGSNLQTKVDLRRYCTQIENQGNLGSCTGQAIAGAIELLNNRNNKPTDVSRLYIYYWERYLMGTINYDSGAYIRDGIKATNKYGAPLEKYWPYVISRFRNRPTLTAENDGKRRKVLRYERVLDHNGCIDALNQGYPIIIGFYVYSSFITSNVYQNGIMPYPNTTRERFLGGHAVLLVGYDTTTETYIARNSWGIYWGDAGYFYMPFRVIQNPGMSMDFWIIKEVQNP